MPKKRLSKSSLLWFIRSRSYVSIPDIRRRFNLNGGDEVIAVAAQQGRVYVGLPSDAARVLGDLVREGRVGLELEPSINAYAAIGAFVVPHHHHGGPDDGYSEPPPEETGIDGDDGP